MRYFFIIDRIVKGHVSLGWCPTGDMTGNFFTKPNQGALFRQFGDLIMGVEAQPEPGLGKPRAKKKSRQDKLVPSKTGTAKLS